MCHLPPTWRASLRRNFQCPVCCMWDQDHQLRLTQRPAKKCKYCSVTSTSPPPPSEVNLEPIEFIDQSSYNSVQPTPLTCYSHPAEMSNVLANINTSLLHISSMLGSWGERSGCNEQAAPLSCPPDVRATADSAVAAPTSSHTFLQC